MSESSKDQFSIIVEYCKIIIREAYRFKYHFAILFAIFSIAILVVGLFASKTYSTSATLYADQSNIIGPLLSGQASITRVEDQVRVVKESIHSPRVLNKVVSKAGFLTGEETPSEIEKKMNLMRSDLRVYGIGGSYIKVSYSDIDPSRTFKVLGSVIEEFIRDSSDSKRNESRQAFEFINSQVEAYKQQLQDAEGKLRQFKSDSRDGSEAAVNNRIASLRTKIESLELDIEGVRTKVGGIETEISNEGRYVVKHQSRDTGLTDSLNEVIEKRDLLLLSYTKTHPDVLALQYQIDDLKKSIRSASKRKKAKSEPRDVSTKSLYGELRSELSEAKVQLKTYLRRLASTKLLLKEEYERLTRVADNQAELSELTRDYNVTKGIYEDMLERKEKARLSMALDVQGRGLNYKVQDPPVYPLTPTGLRFLHYLMLGPLLGLFIPIGFLIAYVLIDPRLRSPNQLYSIKSVEVIGVVGHKNTALRKRVLKKDAIFIGLILLCVVMVYGAVIIYKTIAAG